VVVKRFALPCGSNGDCGLVASIRDEVALERSFQCMRLIDQDSDISTRDLAERMQISNGAAYYVLNALIEKGYVKAENFKHNPKKSGYLYLLTPDGLREKSRLTTKFIQRKRAEYHALKTEIETLERERVETDVPHPII
jgi:EPS-associated MarR family transcriptional regulator